MRRSGWALLVLGCSVAQAQVDVLATRHARIKELAAKEEHHAVVAAIDLQLREAPGTPWQDSIHSYTYPLALAVWRTKDAPAAIAAGERVRAWVETNDRDVLHRLSALQGVADIQFATGRMRDAVRTDSLAMALVRGNKDVPALQQGKAHYRLGNDQSSVGDYERALKSYQEAERIWENGKGVPPELHGDACNGAGSMSWRLGRSREAERYYDQALMHYKASNDPRKAFRMAGVLGNLGILWQDAGDLARSKVNYSESIHLCGAIADTASDPRMREQARLRRSSGFVNLASVYFALGDDGRTRELLELALRERQELLDPDDPKLLGVQDRLADVELEAGNYTQAGTYIRRFMEATRKYFGPRSDDHLRACAKLAEVEAALGHDAVADSLFAVCIDGRRAAPDATTDQGLALALSKRAQFYLDRERPKDALDDLELSRAIVERVNGPGNYRLARTDLFMARASLAAGDARAAERYAARAYTLVQDRGDAIRDSPLPRTFISPGLLSDAIYWKVMAERALDSAAARPHWMARLDLAVLAVARTKATFSDEASQLGLVGGNKGLFDLAVEVAFEEAAATGDADRLDHFLRITESDRSTLLKARLNEFTSMRFAGVPDTIIDTETRLTEALRIDPDEPQTVEDMVRHEKALTTFLERLGRDHPQYFALRYGEPEVSVEDIRKHLLAPGRDLLAYAVTDAHIYMLVVRTDTAALIRVENRGLRKAVERLQAAVVGRDAGAYVTVAHELYTMTFAPVEHLLRNEEVLIIPDGDLYQVNFEALLDAPSTPKDFRSHLLIQRYAIGYLLSATTAVQFSGLSDRRNTGTLAFAPGFSDVVKQRYLADVQDPEKVDRDYLNYVRQPFAVRTAEALSASLSAKVMTGSDANERQFRELAKAHGILHLGTHAELNDASPMYSKLVLGKEGASNDADADGYLHAYELYELDLRAELAVLTACGTGAGKAAAGEGVRSLGYSFAYAGCPSLVISLWNIDEKVSAEIIGDFYDNLASGMPKHKALRRAKLDHLNNASDQLALPYYWAGMVLMGDVDPITIPFWTRYKWWCVGAAFVVIGVWFAFRRSRRKAA